MAIDRVHVRRRRERSSTLTGAKKKKEKENLRAPWSIIEARDADEGVRALESTFGGRRGTATLWRSWPLARSTWTSSDGFWRAMRLEGAGPTGAEGAEANAEGDDGAEAYAGPGIGNDGILTD